MSTGRYRLHVLARETSDLIASLGGLIFDAVMSGWDVRVGVERCPDDRPLQILGAQTASLSTLLTTVEYVSQPAVLAVAADLYIDDRGTQQHIRRMLELPGGEVIVFGEKTPGSSGFAAAEHRSSHAARLFKRYAVTLAGGTPVECATEAFSRSGGDSFQLI